MQENFGHIVKSHKNQNNFYAYLHRIGGYGKLVLKGDGNE